MAENSKIEWTDHTFNPWRGCTKIAEGCKFCYADTLSKRNPGTLGVWGTNGKRVVAAESAWRDVLKWDRQAKADGVRRKVFCASLADVFEDWPGPMVDSGGQRINDADGWYSPIAEKRPLTMQDVRNRLFDWISQTPNLIWLLLTKRPENVKPMLIEAGRGFQPLPPWVWIGYSASTQEDLDRGLPHLLKIPAAVRFLSLEPLLGPINLKGAIWKAQQGGQHNNGPIRLDEHFAQVIVGGESGPHARPMHPDWVRSIRDQCVAAGVPFHFKQHGEWLHQSQDIPNDPRSTNCMKHHVFDDGSLTSMVGKKRAGRLLDGREWNETPEGSEV